MTPGHWSLLSAVFFSLRFERKLDFCIRTKTKLYTFIYPTIIYNVLDTVLDIRDTAVNKKSLLFWNLIPAEKNRPGIMCARAYEEREQDGAGKD